MNTDLDPRINGRTVLITGGSKGLGLAMARAFHGAGAKVALVARDPERLAEAAEVLTADGGAAVTTAAADVADGAQLAAAHEHVERTLGPVDVLINNAGQAAFGTFVDISDEAWQADLDLKLFAAIRLSRRCWPHMATQRWGRIINVLNIQAKAPPAGSAPTAVSRAAGLALTKVLANEGAPHNILVNALLIGSIRSDQFVRWHAAAQNDQSLEEFVAAAGRRLPMGRVGEAEECARLALFLGSEAGSYVTGCGINMDGGLSPVP